MMPEVIIKKKMPFPQKIIDAQVNVPDKSYTSTLFDFSINNLTEVMEKHDVEKAVLYQLGEYTDSKDLAKLIGKQPNIFSWVVTPPQKYYDDFQEIDRLTNNPYIRGLRVCHLGGTTDPFQPFNISEAQATRLWEIAKEKCLAISLNVRAAEAHLVPYFLEAFPDVNVVIERAMIFRGVNDHKDTMNRPHIPVTLPASTKYTVGGWNVYANLYITLGGYYSFSKKKWPYEDVNRWHQPENMVNTFGAEKIMWAGDYPWIIEDPGYEPTIEFMKYRLQNLSEKKLQDIFFNTANRLFFDTDER